MKLFFILIFLITSKLYSQSSDFQIDTRNQLLKEDSMNSFNSDEKTILDILQALEVAGISIHKFKFGNFDKLYNFSINIDEFKDGKLVNADTLILDNQYHFYEKGLSSPKYAFIDQIKVIAKMTDSSMQLNFKTYGMEFKWDLLNKKISNESFYSIREYYDTHWKYKIKIPILTYASSWEDTEHKFQRFCGVAKLQEGEKGTNELLSHSPHYYTISYIVY